MKIHHRFADFLLIVLLFIILLLVTLATPLGTKAIVTLVNTMLPLISIEGESGTLLRDLHIDKLTIKNKTIHIEFIDLNIDWLSSIYKNSKLNIKQLRGKTLNIYLAEKEEESANKKTIIPNIPIPIDMIADRVALDALNIINADDNLLFQAKNMEVMGARIIDNLLTGETAKATLVINKNPMLVNLKKAELDFDQPHAIKGQGGIHYSHIHTGTFDGTVNVAGTLTDYELEGMLDWDEQILGHSELQVKGSGDYRGVIVEKLIIDNESALLDIKGTLSWVDAFKWNFSIKSDNVRTKKYRPDWPAEFTLDMSTKGSYHYKQQKWFVLIDTHKIAGNLSRYPLQASGKIIFKDSLLRVKQIDLKSGDNRLKVDGKITEPFVLKWDIKANKLKQLLPDAVGSINGKGILTGTTIKPSGQGTLLIKKLASKGIKIDFADIKLKAGTDDSLLSGKVLAKIKNVTYKDFSVVSADIDFKGSEKESLRLGQGIFRIKQLKSKQLSVKSVDLEFKGSEKKLLVLGKGTLRIKQLETEQLSLQSAKVAFNGHPQKLDLEGMIKNLIIAGKTIKTTKVSAKGALDKHQIVLNSTSKEGELYLQAEGSLENAIWKGLVKHLRLNNTAVGHWRLNKPVKLHIADKRFSSSEICLNNPKRGYLCSTIKWQKGNGFQAKGILERVPLAQLKPWLANSINFMGSINGQYNLQQKADGFYGQASFWLPNSFIRYKTTSGLEKIPYRNGKILVNFNGNTITSSADLLFDERGKLNTKATITLLSSFEQHKIVAKAHLSTTHLAWLNDYVPDINKLKGQISSTINVHGRLKQPVISGELMLKDGQIKVPDTGTYLSAIQLKIQSGKQNKAYIKGSLLAGKGKLNMTGWLNYSRLNAWIAQIKLKGHDLHLMNTHEVQAYASPNLDIKATPKSITILGHLHIPRAKITLDEIPETAVYESDDVVFTGIKNNNVSEKKNPLRIIPNVKISLGDNIHFDGFGLKAQLKGNFHVTDNLNTILSRGTLSIINGQYRAYGQILTIEHGVLVFNGPLGNPGLNIRATRNVEDLKVGLNLAGTLQEPKSSVFSDPTLPEDDALSYLLTGQKLADSGDDDTQLLLQAVRTLGINSGSNLLNRIGGSFGLDDVNVVTFEDYRRNRLQLGKRLGADLYIRYITGLFDTFHKIAIDYRISKKWSLQAESGEEQAIDFIYELR
ncbi:MAG TPA: hypothetical protein ENJ28_06465 [Gammaproteobacteria bacterium]|nr:hypothetical protein [Gammaproteobacteria bacterium]